MISGFLALLWKVISKWPSIIIKVPGGFFFFKLPEELVIIKFFIPNSLKTNTGYVTISLEYPSYKCDLPFATKNFLPFGSKVEVIKKEENLLSEFSDKNNELLVSLNFAIEEITKSMVLTYIKDDRTIALVVIPANADISTSDGLKLCREVDPNG